MGDSFVRCLFCCGILGSWFGHAELLFPSFPCFGFVLVFALLAVVSEGAVVAWAFLFPLFYFFGFFSHVFKGVAVHLRFESAMFAYKKSVVIPH